MVFWYFLNFLCHAIPCKTVHLQYPKLLNNIKKLFVDMAWQIKIKYQQSKLRTKILKLNYK